MKKIRQWFLAWSPRRTLLVAVSAIVVVLDQLSKFWAVGALTQAFQSISGQALPFGQRVSNFLWLRHPYGRTDVVILDHFWRFIYAENPGAAWSFLAWAPPQFRVPFFLIVAFVAMVGIVIFYHRTVPVQKILRLSLALVLGGALGNFLDRVRLGYVIDFVQWHWYDQATWPTFNVADAAITVGVVLMLIDMFFLRQGETAKAASKKSAP